MPIYTKKGDKGQTAVLNKGNQKKLKKSAQVISAVGAIDELNSFLGMIVAATENHKLKQELIEVQENLLTIGSIVGGSDLRFFTSNTKYLERKIDQMDKNLSPLNQFIVPGGSIESSQLQFARTLTRRAERWIIRLTKVNPVKPQILTFLNRLSDYFFVLARSVNADKGIKDRVWVRSKK